MSMSMHSPSLVASLEHARFEIVPMKGVEAQLPYLPPGAVVTVTASPTKGLEPTLDLVATVAQLGHHAVPHLAARSVAGHEHLRAILSRLAELDVREAFVVAGDARHPAGPFDGAGDLLEAMAELDHGLDAVGITGYPEAHGSVPDQVTIEAMARKAPHATYIVSQICYEPGTIRAWIGAVRDRGIWLPIHIGLPGVIDRARLLRLSLRVGLGDSVRYLSKQSEVAGHALIGYQPDELVAGLADLVGDPDADVRGWHLFTFNEVARTEQWRQEQLAATRGVAL